jgi:hypothetical protein
LYDKYAISWGYRPILDKDAKEEKATLDSWILEKAGDPIYRFGRQQGNVIDPSSQTEDLGDDAVKASMYGIKNLQRILPNLEQWTSEKGETYDDLATMYGQIASQFARYMGHVSSNVGGIYENYKTTDQEGAVYTHVDKARQKESLQFVIDQLFVTPTWMLDKDLFSKVQSSGAIEDIRALQVRTLNGVLSADRMARMIENETLNGSNAYTLVSMFSELRKGVWSELYTRKSIDTYRRNLQKAHIERLDYLLNKAPDQMGRYGSASVNVGQSDIKSFARGELNKLRSDVKSAASRTSDTTSRYHLEDVVARIDMALDPK